MKTAKEEALELLDRLPDDVTTEVIIAELGFVLRVRCGIEQADKGEVVSHHEVRRRLSTWLR